MSIGVIVSVIISAEIIFKLCVCVCFLQRKECYTELAILGTAIYTKEHRGLAHQAAPSCPRSQLLYMDENAFMIQSKFFKL